MRCLLRICSCAEAGIDWIWTDLVPFISTGTSFLRHNYAHRFPTMLRSITWLRTNDTNQQIRNPLRRFLAKPHTSTGAKRRLSKRMTQSKRPCRHHLGATTEKLYGRADGGWRQTVEVGEMLQESNSAPAHRNRFHVICFPLFKRLTGFTVYRSSRHALAL